MRGEPQTQKNVRVQNEVKVIYLRLLKALYGCMESALMCYDLHFKPLKLHGFLINTYDRCIENSTIQDKQCTIVWYVDDKKVSNVDEEVNTKVIETISYHFGNLTVSRREETQVPGNGYRVLRR